MSNPEFDWINLLPEAERKTALVGRETFFKGFPVLGGEIAADAAELEEAGRSGRACLEGAINIVDGKKIDNAIMDLADMIGGTPTVTIDARAWQHLLVYIPIELLTEGIANKSTPPKR